MGLFDKIFEKKAKIKAPDNDKLKKLLEGYYISPNKNGVAKIVVREILTGDSFLIFPTNKPTVANPYQWQSPEEYKVIILEALKTADGIKVLSAFSDVENMKLRLNRSSNYITVLTRKVIGIMETNNVQKLIINSGQPTKFILNRRVESYNEKTIEHAYYGPAVKPIRAGIINKLIEEFKKETSISEVFHGELISKEEKNTVGLVFYFKISPNTMSFHDLKESISFILNTAFEDEAVYLPVYFQILNSEDDYRRIKNTPNMLFYKRY